MPDDTTKAFTAAIREAAQARRIARLSAARARRGRPPEYGPVTAEGAIRGRHLRRARVKLAMSQEVLARDAGVSVNFVVHLEDGAEIRLRRERIDAVRRVLGLID